MKNITKFALGTVMLCGVAVAATAPAAAQVSFGIGVNPGYPAYASSCYDAYGNYLYSYPYCTAYGAPAIIAPSLQFGFGDRHDRDDHHFDRGDRGHMVRGGDRGEHHGR
jgi:hypothetical protein